MNIEDFIDYCKKKEGVSEEFPFDQVSLVLKVYSKIFAITCLEGDFSINLKCDPERSLELREIYPSIKPGFHMNKKHWNTIEINGSIPIHLIYELIDHSYRLVYDKIPKKQKP